MCGHFGIGAIDQTIVARGLDDRRLGHEKMRRAAGRLERMCMGADLINEGLVAHAKVKLDAPRTATKICVVRISPVSRSSEDDRHAVAGVMVGDFNRHFP
jgi:hypothetical protein